MTIFMEENEDKAIAAWNTRSDLIQPQNETVQQITARSVDEVRNGALEEAAQAMRPVLRSMLSRTEAAAAIRALKSHPAPAPAHDGAVQRLRKAAQAVVDHDLFYDREYLSFALNAKLDDLRTALVAMEGR